jgi:prepilin-type N-terminal cleavage/methylation domain-containing protein
MKRKKSKRLMHDCRGFSLIEVLLGITIFMIGMLGVTALNISSLKSNTFSGNLSEATLIAATKIEELMATDFDDIEEGAGEDDGNHTTNRDVNDDGIDDGGNNFGLDDTGTDADYNEGPLGKNGMYTVYWNVAENEPISVPPPPPLVVTPLALQRTKTINVIVEWYIKDEPRRINMEIIRMKE